MDTWIELYNASDLVIDVSNWAVLFSASNTIIAFTDAETQTSTVINPNVYLVCGANNQIFSAGVSVDLWDSSFALLSPTMSGQLVLYDNPDASGSEIDRSNIESEGWCAGSEDGQFSMERIDPTSPGDRCDNWKTNDGVVRNGLDWTGNQINGTPGQRNSTLKRDLFLVKSAADPDNITDDVTLTWTIFHGETAFQISVYTNIDFPLEPFEVFTDVVSPFIHHGALSDASLYFYIVEPMTMEGLK